MHLIIFIKRLRKLSWFEKIRCRNTWIIKKKEESSTIIQWEIHEDQLPTTASIDTEEFCSWEWPIAYLPWTIDNILCLHLSLPECASCFHHIIDSRVELLFMGARDMLRSGWTGYTFQKTPEEQQKMLQNGIKQSKERYLPVFEKVGLQAD